MKRRFIITSLFCTCLLFKGVFALGAPKKYNGVIPNARSVYNSLSFKENLSLNSLNTKENSWCYQVRKDGMPPEQNPQLASLLEKYNGYSLGDTNKKEIYLTFDQGYENGYTNKILDVLKANDVKANFFVVKPYLTSNSEIVKRMVDEGHLVANHSVNHPSMAKVTDESKFKAEFEGVENSFKELTGKDMPKFFRPPMGKYSEQSLDYTQRLGYKTIFWSFAYYDWVPDKQPTHEAAKKTIMERTHNGCIALLHSVSKTNSEILDDVIKEWKSRGFELKTLDQLPQR